MRVTGNGFDLTIFYEVPSRERERERARRLMGRIYRPIKTLSRYTRCKDIGPRPSPPISTLSLPSPTAPPRLLRRWTRDYYVRDKLSFRRTIRIRQAIRE